jgi:hypothetical protein
MPHKEGLKAQLAKLAQGCVRRYGAALTAPAPRRGAADRLESSPLAHP